MKWKVHTTYIALIFMSEMWYFWEKISPNKVSYFFAAQEIALASVIDCWCFDFEEVLLLSQGGFDNVPQLLLRSAYIEFESQI